MFKAVFAAYQVFPTAISSSKRLEKHSWSCGLEELEPPTGKCVAPMKIEEMAFNEKVGYRQITRYSKEVERCYEADG